MKIYVSIDLEGLPGIASVTQLAPKYPQYEDARKIMSRIARAVAEELLSQGVDEVYMADSHGHMLNLYPWELPRGVRIIQGSPRPLAMVQGLDSTFSGAMFLGYHAAAGTARAYADHTISSAVIHRIRVNGVPASEYLINALVAGELGVPVILVAGDEALKPEVEKFTPWAQFVALKRGLSRYAAAYESLDDVEAKLRQAVARAIDVVKRGEAKPLKLASEYIVEIETVNSGIADAAELIPGIERIDSYLIRFRAKSAVEMLKMIELVTLVGAAVLYMLERLR